MNNEGVSAVIGVILMVAITVILAAVIAAFVFNIVPTASSGMPFAFKPDGVDQVTISNNGGLKGVTTLVIHANDYPDSTFATESGALLDVGSSVTIGNGSSPIYDGCEVTIVGFMSGEEVVLAHWTSTNSAPKPTG